MVLAVVVLLFIVNLAVTLWTLYRVHQVWQQAVLTNVLIQQGQEVIARLDRELH
jgi:CHASE3 domain sensor protein